MTIDVQKLEGIEPPIQIYIRRTADDDRSISFKMPEWFSQGEAMDRGWAIDGSQILFVVSKKELHSAEKELVEWFRQKGHGITFC